jgi:hypothetical protein
MIEQPFCVGSQRTLWRICHGWSTRIGSKNTMNSIKLCSSGRKSRPVYCRHRRSEWHTGEPWLDTLPKLDPGVAEWDQHPFQRGFGWSVRIRQLATFLDIAEELFRIVPIGQLSLPSATLADWQRLMEQPWLKQIQSIRFYGLESPIEAVRQICRNADRTNVQEIIFEQSSRPAIPVLIEDLVQSEIGQQLKSMEFEVGPDNTEELLEAILSGQAQLEQLAFRTYRFDSACFDLLLGQSAMLRGLKRFALLSCYLEPVAAEFTEFLKAAPFVNLEQLAIRHCMISGVNFERIGLSPGFTNLKVLDLTGSRIGWLSWEAILLAPYWTGLRCFRLAEVGISSAPLEMRELMLKGRFWRHLVELDLRDNFTNPNSIEHFAQAELPVDMTALLLRKPSPEYAAKAIPYPTTRKWPDALLLEEYGR